MYATFNEGKSVMAERFIGTLKNKIYNHKTAISKNVYHDALGISSINTIIQFTEQ